jgi:hypothetical protein
MGKTEEKIMMSFTPLPHLGSTLPSVYVSSEATVEVQGKLSFWSKFLAA